nr:MAG TPA_asm: hypothetical protein [Caudoviricetes sp.]
MGYAGAQGEVKAGTDHFSCDTRKVGGRLSSRSTEYPTAHTR